VSPFQSLTPLDRQAGSKWGKALGALAVVELAAESRVLNNKMEAEIEEAYAVTCQPFVGFFAPTLALY